MRNSKGTRVVAIALTAGLVAGGASAQLATLIPDVFGQEVEPTGGLHTEAHFNADAETLSRLAQGINSALAAQLSTFPLGSPGGGLTYVFDENTGAWERSSDSLGSSFTDRALTVGKGKWNYGLNFFSQSYDSIDDLDLRNGEIQLQLRHDDTNNDGSNLVDPFEGDLVRAEMKLGLSSDTVVGFATYGFTDRFDVTLAVPFVSVDLKATNDLTVDPLATSGVANAVHAFENTGSTSQVSRSDSASGVGDILVRGKYRFSDAEGGGVAVGLDVRLPTGDEDELLGSGGTQIKPSLIGSRRWGRVTPHFNLAYGFSSGSSDFIGEIPDEIGLAVGLEILAGKSATVTLDYIGRQLKDATRIVSSNKTFQFRDQVTLVDGSAQRPEARAVTDDLDLSLGVIGLRFNPTGSMVVSLNAVFPLGSDGLQNDNVSFTIGLDFSR